MTSIKFGSSGSPSVSSVASESTDELPKLSQNGTWKRHQVSLGKGQTGERIGIKERLEKTYGEFVASIVDQSDVLNGADDNVSKKTFEKARRLADYWHRECTASVIAQELELVCRAAKLPANGLTNEERIQLGREIDQAIKTQSASVDKLTTFDETREIVKGVVEPYLKRRLDRLNAQFPDLGALTKLADTKEVNDLKSVLDVLECSDDPLEKQAGTTLRNALDSMTSAQSLLSQVPISAEEIKRYHGELGEMKKTLIDHQSELAKLSRQAIPPFSDVATAIYDDVSLLRVQVVEKEKYVRDFHQNRPLLAKDVVSKDVASAKKTFLDAAIALIARAKPPTEQQEKLRSELQRQRDAVDTKKNSEDWAVKGDKGGRGGYEKRLVQELLEAGVLAELTLGKRIKRFFLKRLHGHAIDQQYKTPKELFEEAHSRVLNKMDWAPIKTQVQFTLNGQMHQVQSEVTPARHVAGELILTEVGKLLDDAAIIELKELNGWLIVLDEQLQLFAEYLADQQLLYLSADVGDPPAERRLEVYEMLLQINLDWHESGGVRFGIDSPGGTVVQVVDIDLENLGATQLRSIIAGFLEMLVAWRRVVTAADAEPSVPEPLEDHMPMLPPDGTLRV